MKIDLLYWSFITLVLPVSVWSFLGTGHILNDINTTSSMSSNRDDDTNAILHPVEDVTLVPVSPPHPVWPRYKRTTKERSEDPNLAIITQAPDVQTACSIQDSETEEDDDAEDIVDDIGDDKLPMEQRLMKKLLKTYEKSVRPVKNASDTLVVRMGITLTQIFQMNEKEQVLVTNVWLDQEWDDVFLQWDPEDYGGLEVLRLPCHKIWRPDIVLYNNAAEYTDGLMDANVMITHFGQVFWPVPTKLQSSCKVDVTYFPFDEQHCRLKFGSWTYDGFQVDMVNRTIDVDLSNYVANGEWELVNIHIMRNVVYYACCPEPFPDVTFIIHIRRRNIYYLYNVIFPCIMMSTLTLLVFCLPPDSGEKITMGITVLLAFSVFLLRMGEDLPETSEFIPLLSIYLTVVMALTSISVIMTVMVLNLHFRGPRDAPVPGWLKYLFTGRGRVPGLNSPLQSTPFVDKMTGSTSYKRRRSTSLRLTIENLAQEIHDDCRIGEAESFSTRNNNEMSANLRNEASDQGIHNLRGGMASDLSNQRAASSRTNEEILHVMKSIINRYERDDCLEDRLYEWRQVAMGVDKVLFCIFLTATVGATVVILILAPILRFF